MSNNTRIVSILSYFFIGIIWYFIDENVKKSNKARFHVKQALNLFIIRITMSIIFFKVFFIFFMELYFVMGIISIGLFILWVIGLINAINQKETEIPIIGQFAEKYLFF